MENQKNIKVLITLLVSSLLSPMLIINNAQAATIKEAMIAAKSGLCEIFAPATEDLKDTGGAALVIFEGKKYQSLVAKVGMKVQPGFMLRTGTDGKLKVIYNSGDVVVLGPSTAMTVPQVSEVVARPAELVYGKMRASINKEGPLSGFKVATPAAVAGVRGTDFFMSFHPGLSETEVHVLRGKVAVEKVATEKAQEKSQAIEIKTGEKVSVEKEKVEELKAVKTNQVELKQIESSSLIPKAKELEKIEDSALAQELKERETKSVEVVKRDIKEVMGEKVDLTKVTSFEQAQALTVTELNQQAPKGPKKPKRKDFESEVDVYDQFFKPAK